MLQKRCLQLADFTTYANTADVWGEIAEWFVPSGQMILFKNERNIELFLACKDVFSGDGSTVEFTLAQDIVDNERLPDDGGSAAGFVSGVRAAIASINYATHKVTFSSAPAADGNNVAVYSIFKPGELEIRAVAPAGTRGLYKLLFNSMLGQVHAVDQLDSKKDFRLSQSIILPEGYKIAVRLKSSVVVNWDALNILNRISIPYSVMGLEEYSKKLKLEIDEVKKRVFTAFLT